jgi:hypothetical protein
MVDAYAPDPEVLAPTSAETPNESSLQNNGTIGSGDGLMDVADGESDQYEPPGAIPTPKDDIPPLDSPPFSPAPPEASSNTSQTDKQHEEIFIDSAVAALQKDIVQAKSPALPTAQANQVFFAPSMLPW